MFLSQIMDILKYVKYIIYNNLYNIKLTFISQHYDIGLYTLKPPFFLADITRFTSGPFCPPASFRGRS